MHLNFSCCCLRQFAPRKITFRRWNKMQRRKLTWSRSSVWTKTKADSTTLKCLHFNCSTALLWNLHKNSILNAIEARELLHAAIEDRQRVPSNIMSSREIIAKRIKKFMTISLKLEVAMREAEEESSQVKWESSWNGKWIHFLLADRRRWLSEKKEFRRIFLDEIKERDSWPNFLHFLHSLFLA